MDQSYAVALWVLALVCLVLSASVLVLSHSAAKSAERSNVMLVSLVNQQAAEILKGSPSETYAKPVHSVTKDTSELPVWSEKFVPPDLEGIT